MKYLLTLAGILMVMMTACIYTGTLIRGSGNSIKKERKTGEYDAISVSGFYEVELVD